ncbi:AAA family ATPase [Pseudidiomarina marina]|uniref:AAA family ATPase n=1 Tax=Pseudidiomarina marina TaxID=502366 RepID=UPI00384BFE31
MNKWRISRLKINGFKIFSSFEEKYNNSLIIYDGPNGFGKTSLFDAKQLLFRGQLPRIAARLKPVTPNKHSFRSNLYRHDGYDGDISIVAELTNGRQTINIMRKADAKEMKAKNNKPSEFSIFKLYQSESFDDCSSATAISNEDAFWQKHLGSNFQKNFDVLNYLQQDSKALIIPDGCCEDTTRTKQIEHLINLDELNARLDNLKKLKDARKTAYTQEVKIRDMLKGEIDKLKHQLSAPSKITRYGRLTTTDSVPVWDSEKPLTAERLGDYPSHIDSVNLVKELVNHADEVALRERNRKKSAFLQTDEFALAVRLANHVDKLKPLRELRGQRKPLVQAISVAKKNATDLKEADLSPLKHALSDDFDKFATLVRQKIKLQAYQNTVGDAKTRAVELRNRLIKTINEDENKCPLCGFDYEDHQLLIDAIEARTQQVEKELDENERKIAELTQKISQTLQTLLLSLQYELKELDEKFNESLLKELEAHEHQTSRLLKIAERVRQLNIILPTEYAETTERQIQQVEAIRQQIQSSFEQENDLLSEQALALYYSAFKSPDDLKNVNWEAIEDKITYLTGEYNNLVSNSYQEKLEAFSKSLARLEAISKIENKLKATEQQLNLARNTYINQTLGEVELLFHIYSGRLLQNMQTGLGIFLERAEGAQKDTPLQFKTTRGNEHDAALSMSSGQISALALALFLSLNKKYAETAFVFIDDPTQCMDEVNIASLSDLLRVELRDRQVIISTHEQDVANYLAYRYGKAGLPHQKINLLKRHRDRHT